MSGNVWEWCSTKWLEKYDNYEKKADDDPNGDEARVLRGGSFGDYSDDEAWKQQPAIKQLFVCP